ncbi:MAG: PDZ domain-containing protein, partial [Xanthomonadales bacterium]|nr:PDZ domain-containing protein [Xanthomonadales bacterium]
VGATTRGAGHFGSLREFADGQLTVFLPVGRTYEPSSGKDWEGSGIAADVPVAASQALARALSMMGADPAAADQLQPRAPAPVAAVRELNPRARSYGIAMLPPRGGEQSLEILQVRPDGPAAAAGLQAGDQIIEVNGKAVSTLNPTEFGQAMRGSPLQLVLDRAGSRTAVTLSLD